MDLYNELTSLTDALTGRGVDYAVCGGVALAIHGYPRFTKDIDLLVLESDLERALEAARSCGFIIEGGLIRFERGYPNESRIFRISKAEGEQLLTLDLILVTPVLQGVWDGREEYDWKNRRLRVVSRHGLVRMKQLAGRDQDLVDLKRLESDDAGSGTASEQPN